ncbi:MAG TPA: hypothetical protein PLC12_03760, partial [Candidatus Methanofastidiosa archaeon]|nr:hypothetical protein [Candidatus Methanofastidiosa archaeon]
RKYFKINKRIRLEFAMGPYSYTTVSNDALDADISELPDEFPEFKEIMKEVNKARKIKEISMLSKTLGNLRIEHERLTKAKEYVESMIGHVKLQCINVCDEMGLDDSEKRLVLELIGAGGKLSIGDLSDRLKVDENEITDSLKKLKVKGIIKS